MPVSREELKEYLRPALCRKAFRFHQLRGLVDDRTLQNLRVAKAFSRPDAARLAKAFAQSGRERPAWPAAHPDAGRLMSAFARQDMVSCSGRAYLRLTGRSGDSNPDLKPPRRNRPHDFVRELHDSGPSLQGPILRILDRMAGAAGASGVPADARSIAMAEIHGILLECGIHAFFQRPSSAGFMLHQREAGSLPLHLYLGESDGALLDQGKLNLAPDCSGSIEINVTQNAARLVQVLDYWLSDIRQPAAHIDKFRLRLSRMPKDRLAPKLKRMFEKASISECEIPVTYALDIACMRLLMERFATIADSSGSPQEFLARSLNAQIDSTLAHEVAHLEEARATGSVPVHPMVREAFAYFLQAICADPADAFRTMMLRGFDITRVMPSFDGALRSLGPDVFLAERGFLRGWAGGMLEAIFNRLEEQGALKGRPDQEAIRKALTSDYVSAGDMPLIERALCNPNRRISAAEMQLIHAEAQ